MGRPPSQIFMGDRPPVPSESPPVVHIRESVLHQRILRFR